MKMKELYKSLRAKKVKIIYVSHDERLSWSEELDLQRFAEKLRKEGFIPLLAKDFRPHGKEIVSGAIAVCNHRMVLTFSDERMDQAKRLGVPFVEVTDFKQFIKK